MCSTPDLAIALAPLAKLESETGLKILDKGGSSDTIEEATDTIVRLVQEGEG